MGWREGVRRGERGWRDRGLEGGGRENNVLFLYTYPRLGSISMTTEVVS